MSSQSDNLDLSPEELRAELEYVHQQKARFKLDGVELENLKPGDVIPCEDPSFLTFPTGAQREEIEFRYDLICPELLRRLAIVLYQGAIKYAPDNWARGLPYHDMLNHLIRHVSMYAKGLKDEDHLGHALANIMFLIHFEEECHCDQTRQENEARFDRTGSSPNPRRDGD